MSLPRDIARCPGRERQVPEGEWPFPRYDADCLLHCERRRQGIADFMTGADVVWMEPPKETPCPEILRSKK